MGEVKKHLSTLEEDEEMVVLPDVQMEAEPAEKRQKVNDFEAFLNSTPVPEAQKKQSLLEEWKTFLKVVPLPYAETLESAKNVLTWWGKRESEFPKLSKIARNTLAIPATSASSERIFSKMGNINSKLR